MYNSNNLFVGHRGFPRFVSHFCIRNIGNITHRETDNHSVAKEEDMQNKKRRGIKHNLIYRTFVFIIRAMVKYESCLAPKKPAAISHVMRSL